MEGKEVIERLHHDLVVTDIKLMMLQQIPQRTFESTITTGYAEFEYAKKAIELYFHHVFTQYMICSPKEFVQQLERMNGGCKVLIGVMQKNAAR